MSESLPPTPETLLQHAGWIRSLARQLATGHDVDDLVQEAYVAALERPAGAVQSLGAWLGGVLRNRVRQERRGAAHRTAREQDTARGEALPSAEELAERFATHRLLVEEVDALREPYRSAILLRFFEDLTPAEIARRQGVPVATVQSRQTRALAQLRERLDRRHGGAREAWLTAILPLWQRPAPVAAAPLILPLVGALTLSKLLIVPVAAAAAALILTVIPKQVADVQPMHAPVPGASERSELEPVALQTAAGEEAPDIASRTDLHSSVASAEPQTAEAPPLLAGRALDVEGRPLSGVLVTATPTSNERVESDGDGRFTLPAPPVGVPLDVHGSKPGFSEVLSGRLSGGETEVTLVLAPTLSIGGRVVDSDGEGLPEATVIFYQGEGWRANLTEAPAGTQARSWQTTADGEGRFLFEELPRVPRSILIAEDARLRSTNVACPQVDDDEVLLVLDTSLLEGLSLRGRVLDLDGAPVADAWVACGVASARSDADGSFSLLREELRAGEPLRAAKKGWLPDTLEAPSSLGADDAGWPEEVELRLGGRSLSIAGRVIDAEGQPLAERQVWIEDPTVFGPVDNWLSHLESVLAGEFGSMTYLTDEDGHFRIPGLVDRLYTLATVDEETLRGARLVEVIAGREDVVLQLPEPPTAILAGRVVDRSGAPLGGVRVEPGRLVRSWVWPGSEGRPSNHYFHGLATTTDDEGRFRVVGVPSEVAYVHLEGDDILPVRRAIDPSADRSNLEVLAPVRRYAQVEVAGAYAGAQSFRFLDEEGQIVKVFVFNGPGYSSSMSGKLYDGRSPVIAVADTARTIVLRDAEREEMVRMPVELVASETNRIVVD